MLLIENNLLSAENAMSEINEYLKISSDVSKGATLREFKGNIEVKDLFFNIQIQKIQYLSL